MEKAKKLRVIAAQLWIWVVFAVIYMVMDLVEPGKHFGRPFNAAYYAAVTQTTLGSKTDPQTNVAQFVVVCHVAVASIIAVTLI